MLRHADRLSVAERAPLLEEYAAELYIAHRFGDSARAAAEAVALRRELGDDVALVRSLVELSRRRWMAGERQGAQAAVEEAELVAERSGDADSLAHVGAHRLSLLVLDRPASEALDAVPEATARARAARRNDLLALCLDYRGCAQVLRGEWCWLDGRAEDCRLLAEALLARAEAQPLDLDAAELMRWLLLDAESPAKMPIPGVPEAFAAGLRADRRAPRPNGAASGRPTSGRLS